LPTALLLLPLARLTAASSRVLPAENASWHDFIIRIVDRARFGTISSVGETSS